MDQDDDYEVGYGRPPKHSRWVKGQSGNPKGRRKGEKSLAKLVSFELDRQQVVTEGGVRRTLSRRLILAKRLIADALAGKRSAIDEVVRLDQEGLALVQEVTTALATEQDAETRANLIQRIRTMIDDEDRPAPDRDDA